MPSDAAPAPGGLRLTDPVRRQFLTEGAVRLPGLIPRPAAAAMADRLWSAMERDHGLLRGEPRTWPRGGVFKFQALARSGAFDGLLGTGLAEVLNEAAGPGCWQAAAPPQPLVTFPDAAPPWRPPRAGWHLDLPVRRTDGPWPAVWRAFALLAPVEPGGGGTAYVCGSHRLAMALAAEQPAPEVRSKAMVEALMRESCWLAELRALGPERDGRLRAGTSVRGFQLRLAEFTGGTGDVILMHPALLHCGATNVRTRPRLMLSLWVETSPSAAR